MQCADPPGVVGPCAGSQPGPCVHARQRQRPCSPTSAPPRGSVSASAPETPESTHVFRLGTMRRDFREMLSPTTVSSGEPRSTKRLVVVPLWGREPSALWCEPAFRRLEGSLRPQSTQRAPFGTRRRGEVLWRRPSREHTRRGAPPANPRQQGRYDKTPAGDADEGPVKRKAQADEPGPYEAPAAGLEPATHGLTVRCSNQLS